MKNDLKSSTENFFRDENLWITHFSLIPSINLLFLPKYLNDQKVPSYILPLLSVAKTDDIA